MPTRRRGARLRPVVVFALVVGIALVFLTRLVDVQVVHASTLRAESKDRRSVETTLPGTRGSIVDANGTVLARSVPRYTIVASPAVAASAQAVSGNGSVASASARIASALGVPTAGILHALTADPTSQYAVLAALTRAPVGFRHPFSGLRFGLGAAAPVVLGVAAATALPRVRQAMAERDLPDGVLQGLGARARGPGPGSRSPSPWRARSHGGSWRPSLHG